MKGFTDAAGAGMRRSGQLKAMLQMPALEVVLEFLLDAVGQWPALRGHRVRESGIVLRNELVQEGLFGAMPLVTGNALPRAGFSCRQAMAGRVAALRRGVSSQAGSQSNATDARTGWNLCQYQAGRWTVPVPSRYSFGIAGRNR